MIRELGVPIEEVRAVGGGVRSVLWRQLQADIYGESIYRTEVDEGPAYGAALLGGIAAGVYSNVAEARSVVRLRDEVTEPDLERTRIYEEYHQAYRSRYPAQKDATQKLSDLAAEHG